MTSVRGMWAVQTRNAVHYLDLRDLDAPAWCRAEREDDGALGPWIAVGAVYALRPKPRDSTRGVVQRGLPVAGDHLVAQTEAGLLETTQVEQVRRLSDDEAKEVRV